MLAAQWERPILQGGMSIEAKKTKTAGMVTMGKAEDRKPLLGEPLINERTS